MNTLLSVAHAGGQGKTTLAQLLYLSAKKLGQTYNISAADFLDENGQSKFGKLYPNRVHEFGVGAALTAARTENNPNAALRYWDKIGHIFLEGGYVLDIGANVISSLIDWADDRNLANLMEKKKSPKVDFFCICKAEKHAVDDISKLIEQITSKKLFRTNRIFVVMNEVAGGFDKMNLQHALSSQFTDINLIFLTLPKCQSEIWPAMERNGVSLERVLELEEEQAVELLDIDLWTASAGLAELRAWFDFVVQMLRDKDVFVKNEMKLAAVND